MIDKELVSFAMQEGYSCFCVLGACARRANYIPDILPCGYVLKVRGNDRFVRVERDNDLLVGIFPPDIARAYYDMPCNQRITHVVVARDTNLNDKYGQLFVYPVTQKIDMNA